MANILQQDDKGMHSCGVSERGRVSDSDLDLCKYDAASFQINVSVSGVWIWAEITWSDSETNPLAVMHPRFHI